MIKNKKTLLLSFAGIFFGLLLVLGVNFIKSDESQTNSTTTQQFINEYTKNTELKLKALIENISGVEDVNVMVMLKSVNKNIYAENGSGEDSEYVIVDKSPIYLSETLPEIQGVAVVCKGGSDTKIKNEITNIITSTLGIYSTHVYVTE